MKEFCCTRLLVMLVMASVTAQNNYYKCVEYSDNTPPYYFGACHYNGSDFTTYNWRSCINICGWMPYFIANQNNYFASNTCDSVCKSERPDPDDANSGWCVYDWHGGYPNCQNERLSEWAISDVCPNGYNQQCVLGRYYCHGYEIEVNNLIVGALNPGQYTNVWITRSSTYYSNNNACHLTPDSVSCQLVKADVRPNRLGGGAQVNTSLYVFTKNSSGVNLDLYPYAEWNCQGNVNIICGKSYGDSRWREASNEFLPSYDACTCSAMLPYSGPTSFNPRDYGSAGTVTLINGGQLLQYFPWNNSHCTSLGQNFRLWADSAKTTAFSGSIVTLSGNLISANIDAAQATETFYIEFYFECCSKMSTAITVKHCGGQAWTVSPSSKLIVTRTGNATTVLTNSEIQSWFTYAEVPNSDCKAEGFFLCNDATCGTPYTGQSPRFDPNATPNGSLLVRPVEITTSEQQSSTVYLVSNATGPSYGSMRLDIRVCNTDWYEKMADLQQLDRTVQSCESCNDYYDVNMNYIRNNWFKNGPAFSECMISEVRLYTDSSFTAVPATTIAQITGINGVFRLFHKNGGRYQFFLVPVFNGEEFRTQAVNLNITFCANIFPNSVAAATLDRKYVVGTTLQNVQDVWLWYNVVTEHNLCKVHYEVRQANGDALPADSQVTINIYTVKIDPATPFKRTEFQLRAYDDYGSEATQQLWIEVCGTQTLKAGSEQNLFYSLGQHGGTAIVSAQSNFELFTLVNTTANSLCAFTSVELMSCSGASCTTNLNNPNIWISGANVSNMRDIYITTTNGFAQVQFWLRYHFESLYADQPFTAEVCYESLTCISQNTTQWWRDSAHVAWSPADILSNFTITNEGSNQGSMCGYQSFDLFSDQSATLAWNNPLVTVDPEVPQVKTAKGYKINISTRVEFQVFIRATTKGNNRQCTAAYSIEVCDLEANGTFDEFVYLKNENNGSYVFPIAHFFSTPETPGCFFQNYSLLFWDSMTNVFQNYTLAYPSITFTKTSNPLTAQTNMTINTEIPFHKNNAPANMTLYVEDRFGGQHMRNFSLLVCGLETISANQTIKPVNYFTNQSDGEGNKRRVIFNITQYFTGTIPKCPVAGFYLYDSTAKQNWTQPEIIVDLPRDLINISTTVNLHKKLEIVAYSGSGRQGTMILDVNVCGGQQVMHSSLNSSNYEFDQDPGTSYSLVQLANLTTDFTEWFDNSDPLCSWTNSTLTEYDNETDSYVPYSNSLIHLDSDSRDIVVTANAKLNTSFYLNVSSMGGPWEAHKINVFICGDEKVKIIGGKSKYTIRYDSDSVRNYTADWVIGNFNSTIKRCPVTTYNLVKGDEESKDFDGGILKLDTDERPFVDFNFKRAYDAYEKIQPFKLQACTHAKQCNEIEIVLDKITCDESALLSDGIPITQSVTIESEPSIGAGAYKESFLATNPKCPVTSFGLLWTQGEEDPQQDLDGAVSMDAGGKVTIHSEEIVKLEKASLTFEIVGVTDVGKRAFKTVTLDIALPEKPEEENSDNSTEDSGNSTEAASNSTEGEEAEEEDAKKDQKQGQAGAKKRSAPKTKMNFGGVVFKGVEIPDKDEGEEEEEVEQVIPVPPKMTVEPITDNGTITIRFDQKMYFPSQLNQNFYNSMFRITYISNGGDVSYETQRFQERSQSDENNNPKLRQLEEEDEEEEMQFNAVTVLKHTDTMIQMKLNFSHPSFVSRGTNKDELSITFLEPAFFISAENSLPLEIAKNERIVKIVPTQIEKNMKESLEGAASNAQMAIMTAGSSNVIIAQLIGGSVQIFWGMMRAIQLIVLNGLIDSPQPSHVSVLMQALLNMAQYDVFDAQDVYLDNFDLKEVPPLNGNFEFFGVVGKNLVVNSGSFFPFIIIFSLMHVAQYILHKLALLSSRWSLCRKIGVKIDKEIKQQPWLAPYQKLFLEVYFDLFLNTMLHLYSWAYDNDGEGMAAFFKTRDDQWCTVLVVVMTFFLLYMPIWIYRVITKNFGNLEDPMIQWRYSLIVEDNRTNQKVRALYMFFFIIRRCISSWTLIVLIDYPYFQLVILLALSLMNMNYIIGTKPLKNQNYMELMNEMTIYIVVLMMCNFMNSAMPLKLSDDLGWLLIGVVGTNMLINITKTCFDMAKNFIQANWYYFVKKKVKDLVDKNIHNRNSLLTNFPEDTRFYQNQIKEEKALEFCRVWNQERRWLKEYRVDLGKFPEEAQFQAFIKEFNFLPRAYLQRMKKSQNYLAIKQTHEDLEKKRIRDNFDKHMHKEDFQDIMKGIKLANKNEAQGLEGSWTQKAQNTAAEEQISSTKQASSQIQGKAQNLVRKPTMQENLQTIVKRSKSLQLMEIEEETDDFNDSLPNESVAKLKPNKSETKTKQEPAKIFDNKVKNITEVPKLDRVLRLMQDIEQMEKDKEVAAMAFIEPLSCEEDKAKMLPLIIQEKTDFIYQKKLNLREKLILEEMKTQERDATFLLDQNFEEYGDELENVIKQDEPVMAQFHRNSGLCLMGEGGENDYIQAVIQCFTRQPVFAEYFMTRAYRNNEPQLVCDIVSNILRDANCDKAQMLEVLNVGVSLIHLQRYMMNIFEKPAEPVNATDFLTELLKSIKSEVRLTKKGSKDLSEQAKMFKKMFYFTQIQHSSCHKGHSFDKKTTLQTHIKLKNEETLQEFLDSFCNVETMKEGCQTCKETNDRLKHKLQTFKKYKTLEDAPQFLIFYLEAMDKSGKIIDRKPIEKLTKFLVTKLFPTHSLQHQKYDLVSLVDLQGTSLEDSVYTAYSKRKSHTDNSKNKWYAFQKDKMWVVEKDEFMKETKPQILVYHLQ